MSSELFKVGKSYVLRESSPRLLFDSLFRVIYRYSFHGNCFLSDKRLPLQRPMEECFNLNPNSNPSQSSKLYEKIGDVFQQPPWFLSLEIIAAIISIIFLATLIFITVKLLCIFPASSSSSPTRKKTPDSSVTVRRILKNAVRLSREELEIACEDFSNIIGPSSNNIVYKGTMDDGREIAVISLCVSVDDWTSQLELYFQTEVNPARTSLFF